MTLRRLVGLLILTAALVAAAALRLRGGAGITVGEWRNAPAGSALGVVFDEPAHPPWTW
jgi:hypothetical protein